LDAANAKWQQQLRALQQKHAAGEAELATSHAQELAAQQKVLRAEADARIAAADSAHAQQLQQLQQQLAAARALASTIEDGAGQQAARLQQQLHQEQQAVADLQQQASQLREQLQEAASKLQDSDVTQVRTGDWGHHRPFDVQAMHDSLSEPRSPRVTCRRLLAVLCFWFGKHAASMASDNGLVCCFQQPHGQTLLKAWNDGCLQVVHPQCTFCLCAGCPAGQAAAAAAQRECH
jgi:hypothetical protein